MVKSIARPFVRLLQSIVLCGLVGSFLAACSPRQMIVSSVADELATQNLSKEDDLVLAREAGAFYLKLSESLLQQSPGNLNLAEAVAGGFTQYSFAFVAFEADKLESMDAKAARKLRQRAARLYWRGHRHAIAALEDHSPGFSSALASPDPAVWPSIAPSQTAVAYWAAASWGAAIALSKDNPEVVADLPLAIRLARLIWKELPNQANGSLAILMGNFEAARPGGSRVEATKYFDQAIALGHGLNAGAFVAKAEAIAQADGDRANFESLLGQALAASIRQQDLPNAVMAERAQWLLDSADDLF